jgi:serine phosphatase RsbU (regulator of sigma subunit)
MSELSLGRVLIVDDEVELTAALREMLAEQGYETVGFPSGRDALAALQARDFDLLLADLMMPEMDGITLLQAGLALDPDLVGMIMTGQGTVQTAVDAMKVGAFDYILKPFKLVALLPVLARAMEVRRLRLQARQLRVQNTALTRQLEAELARAAEVQAALLPHEVPRLPGFELAARCVPAHEVGGDFYDWQEITPGVLTLTVGDVMGKGMPAALLMASTRATIHVVARQNPPAAALELAQQALEPDFEHTGGFVTLFHAQLHVGVKRLLYVDAGHGHVFVRRADGTVEALKRGGRPLGIRSPRRYQEAALTFQEGDALIVYSDGLLEARPETDVDHPVLAAHLRGATSATNMVEQLVEAAALTGPPPDDLTVVVLRCYDEH